MSREASEVDSRGSTGRGRSRRSGGWRDLVTALILFLVAFGVYLASPVTQMYDSRYLTAVSHSLIEDGRFVISSSIEVR